MRIIKGLLMVWGAFCVVLVGAALFAISAVNDFRTIPLD